MTPAELTRFIRKLRPEGECLIWTGCLNSKGYGCVGHEGKVVLAHRLAHEAWVGPIPEGYEVDHTCRRTACCAPIHLEAVTPAENVRRRSEAFTVCRRGHAMTPANTYLHPRGHRECKTCRRERQRVSA